MECRCAAIEHLEGNEAVQYVEHMRRLSVDNEPWDAIYDALGQGRSGPRAPALSSSSASCSGSNLTVA